MIKLFIATPMFGGKCDGPYTSSLVQLVAALHKANIDFVYSTILNESNVGRARDNLAKSFLESPCTHLLFIDADIEFDYRDVFAMLGENKDLIGGAYTKKVIRWEKIKNALRDQAQPQHYPMYTGDFAITLNSDRLVVNGADPTEVRWLATGFLLISRKVFEDILKLEIPKYIGKFDDKNYWLNEFFPYPIIDGVKLTEDYGFCDLARKAGHTPYWAPYVQLIHWGAYGFSGHVLASHSVAPLSAEEASERCGCVSRDQDQSCIEPKTAPSSAEKANLVLLKSPTFVEDTCGTRPHPIRVVSGATSDTKDSEDTK